MQISDSDFHRLRNFMQQNYGINLANKMSLIEGRLSNMIHQKGFDDFKSYIDHVMKDADAEELALLVSKLTTNYTYFMREEQHYKFLTNRALPYWETRIRDHDLRTWSAGCSSGEEAYTTAMVYDQYFGVGKQKWDTSILATDISQKVLNLAKTGIYSEDKLKMLPPAWQKKYFERVDDTSMKVREDFRKQVTFGFFNLMEKNMPFRKKFHIIFCRNVMIYFDNRTREDLIRRFYSVTADGGYIFIGLSETMSNLQTSYEYVMPGIYRKGNG